MSVVAGEASESDEEVEQTALPDLKVDPQRSGDPDALLLGNQASQDHFAYLDSSQKPKYDSILHKKLRERNLAFHNNMRASLGQVYRVAAKDIQGQSQMIIKSKSMLEEICEQLQQSTSDLDQLGDKVDIVTSCKMIPAFHTAALSEVSARAQGASAQPAPSGGH